MEEYYTNLKKLDNPENEISVFDENHCSPNEKNFSIIKYDNEDKDSDSYDFIISGDNSESFNGKCTESEIKLYTKNDNSIFYYKSYFSNGVLKNDIYTNVNEDNAISVVKPKGTGSYKVEFINLAKGQSECFEIVSNINSRSCYIYYGKKIDNAPLICKIIRKGNDCEVKIASRVDYIFMLGLASFFFCDNIYKNSSSSNKNSYDSMARMTMPTTATSTIINKDVSKNKFDKENYIDISKEDITREDIPKPLKKKKPLYLLIPGFLCCCCLFEDCCKKKIKDNEAVEEAVPEGIDLCIDCGELACDCCECSEGCDGFLESISCFFEIFAGGC